MNVSSRLGSLVVAVAVVALAGCGDGGANVGAGDDQNVTAASATAASVSALECTVGKGVDTADDVAKVSFKIKGFGTPGAKFVEHAGTVLDKAGHALESDGEHMSVVAEGFENGAELQQCRNDPKKGVVCGSLVLSLDNSGSEMPVTITLTKKTNYRKGTLTVDNTINTGDNSGFLHAPLDCTIDGK